MNKRAKLMHEKGRIIQSFERYFFLIKEILQICIDKAGCLITCSINSKNNNRKNAVFDNAEIERKAWNDLSEIPKPAENSTIYIKVNDASQYSPFFYGPGSMINLLFQDNSYKTVIMNRFENITFVPPYVVLDYQNEHVKELTRSN